MVNTSEWFDGLKFDVIVIGAGISGLTAAALLAKRGLKVAVFEKTFEPGGSCGIFKRGDTLFDQGAAMLYGFGDKGFNPHRFVFNCLEEPIRMIKHDQLYCINYKGNRILFHEDLNLFADELGQLFPLEKDNIKRFYKDLNRMYQHVMAENPVYSSPDEADKVESMKNLLRHPVSYFRFLSFLNKTTKSLLEQYFSDPEIFKFFDKLTSTYCYTTVEETPAILSAIMFVDNHVGGSYYPAGSTLFLPGKLEKSIEEHDGKLYYESEIRKIIFKNGNPTGVELMNGECYFATDIVYSGTVWNLYGKLIDPVYLTKRQVQWVNNLIPTYPSVVLYTTVEKRVIPDDTLPIEMLIGNPDKLDESEVTLYIMSIDDHSVCNDEEHVVTAIGPTFEDWKSLSKETYIERKEKEKQRIIKVIEKRFPGYQKALRYSELATPLTIERYTNKNGGSVAGPKQMIGQHMFKRLHARSGWDSLFLCGESTIMGTGTPAVTVSGLTAANAILKKFRKEVFTYDKHRANVVELVEKPFRKECLYNDYPEDTREIMHLSAECLFCENPACMVGSTLDIRGVNRRISVGNFTGAKNIINQFIKCSPDYGPEVYKCQIQCIKNTSKEQPVQLLKIVDSLMNKLVT